MPRVTLDRAAADGAHQHRPREAPAGPLSAIPPRMVQAVLAIEDRRFYDHPGIDPIRTSARSSPTCAARSQYLVGGSTHHAAAGARTSSSTPEKSLKRKLRRAVHGAHPRAQGVEGRDPRAVPERRLPRPARVVRASHGVAEAARLFFGKDVSNLSLAEAATIAGVIQSPSALSPFNNPSACQRAAQRRAAGDGRRRITSRRRPPTRDRSRAARSSCSARSKPRRRTSSTSSARRSASSIPG